MAIRLAKHYHTAVVSADSRQIYREMTIGTGKPDETQLAAVPHYLIGHVSVAGDYNAGRFEQEALDCLEAIFAECDIAIVAGGTGLYLEALTRGLDDVPSVSETVRRSVAEDYHKRGLTALQREAESADPEGYAATDQNNPQRLIRLVEVFRETGRPLSAYRTMKSKPRPFHTLKIGLEVEREKLYEQINRRVDDMMARGLADEVRELLPWRGRHALNTVGYTELFDYLDGKRNLEETVDLIKRNSRRYAKRQLTWFRRDGDIRWFDPADLAGMIAWIDAEAGPGGATGNQHQP